MSDNSKLAVIFDVDGVLVDTSEFHKLAWMEAAHQQGWEMTEDDFLATFGMQNPEIVEVLAGHRVDDELVKQIGIAKEIRFRELIKGKASPLGGVKELLADLKSSGFGLSVGSSAPLENVELTLGETDLLQYFDKLSTAEDVSRGKPAPDTFLKAAEKLGVCPGRCAVVEDAIPGVEAALSARMKVVAVTNTRKRHELKMADRVVDSLSELSAKDFIGLISS